MNKTIWQLSSQQFVFFTTALKGVSMGNDIRHSLLTFDTWRSGLLFLAISCFAHRFTPITRLHSWRKAEERGLQRKELSPTARFEPENPNLDKVSTTTESSNHLVKDICELRLQFLPEAKINSFSGNQSHTPDPRCRCHPSASANPRGPSSNPRGSACWFGTFSSPCRSASRHLKSKVKGSKSS